MSRRHARSLEILGPVLVAILVVGCGDTPPVRPRHAVTSPPAGSPSAAEADPAAGVDLARSTWRTASVLAPDPIAFQAAAARGLIAGDRTVWARMADGAWVPTETIEPIIRSGVVGWHSGFVDWGEAGAVRTSADGLSWRDAAVGPGEANLSMLVPAGDRLLLVGTGITSQAGAWLSEDGSTWAAEPDAPAQLVAAAAWPGRGLIVSGSSGPDATIWTSTDGARWTAAVAPTPAGGHAVVSGLALGPSGVVATGDVDGRAAAWQTTGLVDWIEAPAIWGPGAFLASVAVIDGTFVIVGRRSNRPALWSSADGRAWAVTDLPLAGGVDGEAVKIVTIEGAIVVFGYSTKDEGNGGSSRVAPLVWTLDVSP